eukprot:FR742829.1.p1 GENE.FR742829.1~~FR742829.1.p1  ORF type:complete len:166 (+),score=28.10 FR742829.1:72-500(+)
MAAILDTNAEAKGGTKWKFNDPNRKVSGAGRKCGYLDNKEQLEGGVDDGWAFFVLPDVTQGSAVGFCADFPKDKRLKDFPFIILLNGEEVQDKMQFWHDAKTLGVSIQCYGTTTMVQAGNNNLGFRVTEKGSVLKLTHVIWR